MTKMSTSWWNTFFHSRVGPDACVFAGWMRIAYAFLFICNKMLLGADLDWFFTSGRLPYDVGSLNMQWTDYTVFQLAPETPALYWGMHYLALVQGALLMMGIFPRFQLVCMHFNLLCFQNHNDLIWDHEDVMLRMFGFLMWFMPMHRKTVYEWWENRGKTKEEIKEKYKNDSWPVWPFRLWQIEMCYIYIGTGFGKVASKYWRDGTAMYQIAHTDDFYGGIFNPDFLFNRLGPLKFLTWSSLVLECICMLLIWPKSTRFPTLVALLLLHVGIDLSMNMHCFEWLTIMGWLAFLIEPSQEEQEPVIVNKTRRFRVNVFLVILLSSFFLETWPSEQIEQIIPDKSLAIVQPLHDMRGAILDGGLLNLLALAGISQGEWTMFETPEARNVRYEAVMFYGDGHEKVWESPDWKQMSWWVKKRHLKRMTFYSNCEEEGADAIWDSWMRLLAKENGPGIVSIELTISAETVPDPPSYLGWFEPALQRMTNETEPLFTLNLCDDLEDTCERRAAAGGCAIDDKDALFMTQFCRRSCGLCEDVDDITVGSRVSVYWAESNNYHDTTVKKITVNPTFFLLEYDEFDDEDENFEWLTRAELRQHWFRLLAKGNELDENAQETQTTDEL